MPPPSANPSQPIPSSVINLAAGQTFDDQGSGSTGRNISNGIFNNAGTGNQERWTDFTYISALFNNTGTPQRQQRHGATGGRR